MAKVGVRFDSSAGDVRPLKHLNMFEVGICFKFISYFNGFARKMLRTSLTNSGICDQESGSNARIYISSWIGENIIHQIGTNNCLHSTNQILRNHMYLSALDTNPPLYNYGSAEQDALLAAVLTATLFQIHCSKCCKCNVMSEYFAT